MMKQQFESFKRIKYYIFAILAMYGLFIWTSVTGRRVLGDDNESREERAGVGNHSSRSHGGSRFYHK